ncbi:MAG: molybdopterin-dependent oxidoreductase [Pseudomonadota bacterium]
MTLRKKQESVRDYDVVRKTTCCNCPTGCGLKIFIKDHAIVDIFGDEEHPINKGSVCPKGLLSYFHIRNSKRIIYPQIRDKLDQPFRRVDWNEALLFTAKKLRSLVQERGKDSIYIYGEENFPFDYLAGGTWFADYLGTSNTPARFFPYPFGPEGLIKGMFGVPGSQLLMNSPRDWCNSRAILIYCSDLAASDPITLGPIIDARDRGTHLLVIDSKKTATTSKATLGLRVKPGSQKILLKGILHLLIQKGQIEEDFLKEFTIDFDSLKSIIEPFTPQRVARSCWIKKEDVEKISDLIGRSKPIQIIAGDHFGRRFLSDEDLLLCGSLVCLRGSVGIPGGGLNLLNVSPFFSKPRFSVNKDILLPGNESLFSSINQENILHHTTEKIGALFWYGNPCPRLAEGKRTKEALREIPLIIHLSSYPNETYQYSHVSIPMSSWLEYEGLVARNNGRAIQWHNKVADPPGECKSSFEFWSDLAKLYNSSNSFPWKENNSFVNDSKAINIFLKQNPLTLVATVEKMDSEKHPPGGLLWPCTEDADLEFENNRFIKGNIRGRNILFQRGQNYPYTDKRFPTPDGKISLAYLNRIKEEKGENRDINFPFFLTTGILIDSIEEFGCFVSDRDEWTKPGILQIHPQIAKILNIKSGEDVLVENERGSFTAPALLNEDLDPRVVWCPDGVDPYQPHWKGESPRSLFEAPGLPDEMDRPYTMIRLYKPGENKAEYQERIVEFLKQLGQ